MERVVELREMRKNNRPLAKCNSVLKRAAKMFQGSLPCSQWACFDDGDEGRRVADDVKEGHFAVMAVWDVETPKRFVLSLSCLSHPTFLRLLELAEEEFGFHHKGALAIPCRPSELERIITGMLKEREERDATYKISRLVA